MAEEVSLKALNTTTSQSLKKHQALTIPSYPYPLAFVDFYYATFDRNRQELAPLYREQSMLSFEGNSFKGIQAIGAKLVALPFQKVQHQVTTVDAQPSNPQAGPILVQVTGRLLVDDEKNPMQFSQTFQLVPEGNNYWIFNDMFRLNYGYN